jgi:hypothetical protein
MWLDRSLYRLILLSLTFCSVVRLTAQDQGSTAIRSSEELEIIAVVERFLTACGTNDFDALEAMAVPAASAGYASQRDSSWSTSTLSWKEFVDDLRATTDPVQYTEPVQEYTIHISAGRMAFVMADATYSKEGKPLRNNIDFFTLIKIDGQWQFLCLAYVGLPLPTRTDRN